MSVIPCRGGQVSYGNKINTLENEFLTTFKYDNWEITLRDDFLFMTIDQRVLTSYFYSPFSVIFLTFTVTRIRLYALCGTTLTDPSFSLTKCTLFSSLLWTEEMEMKTTYMQAHRGEEISYCLTPSIPLKTLRIGIIEHGQWCFRANGISVHVLCSSFDKPLKQYAIPTMQRPERRGHKVSGLPFK